MPDLLSHILIGYAAATLLSTRYEWLSTAYVTIAMAGSVVPELDHVATIIPRQQVERLTGLPFDWTGLQTGGVVLLVLVVCTLFVEPSERRRVFAVLLVGASTHLVSDALIIAPDGRSQSLFWPLTPYQPPTPGLYTSAQVWPLVAATVLAFVSWYGVRRRGLHHNQA